MSNEGTIAPAPLPVKIGGKDYRLESLNLLDQRDFKKTLGLSLRAYSKLPDEKQDEYGEEVFGLLLWLLVRKNGKSPSEQAAGKWAVGYDELLAQVTIDDLGTLSEAINGFLSIAPESPTTPTT